MPAQLVALTEGPNILLDKPIMLFGRNPECDIRSIPAKSPAGTAALPRSHDYLVVRDLGSTNGIRINGTRTLEGRLKAGDELTIGNHRYQVRWDAVAAAAPSRRRSRRRARAAGDGAAWTTMKFWKNAMSPYLCRNRTALHCRPVNPAAALPYPASITPMSPSARSFPKALSCRRPAKTIGHPANPDSASWRTSRRKPAMEVPGDWRLFREQPDKSARSTRSLVFQLAEHCCPAFAGTVSLWSNHDLRCRLGCRYSFQLEVPSLNLPGKFARQIERQSASLPQPCATRRQSAPTLSWLERFQKATVTIPVAGGGPGNRSALPGTTTATLSRRRRAASAASGAARGRRGDCRGRGWHGVHGGTGRGHGAAMKGPAADRPPECSAHSNSNSPGSSSPGRGNSSTIAYDATAPRRWPQP